MAKKNGATNLKVLKAKEEVSEESVVLGEEVVPEGSVVLEETLENSSDTDEFESPDEDEDEEIEEDIVRELPAILLKTPEPKTPEVTFAPSTPAQSERLLKVRFALPYKGCIGGTWYNFSAGEVANVPANLKRILESKDGVLRPL